MPSFKTSDGLNLSYHDEGSGHAILCLPGLTRNQHDFEEFLTANNLNSRVIALTSRGRLPSDFDPNPTNYNVPQEAKDVIELLDHLGIDKTMIIGTSRGGLIAMLLSVTHPNRIAGAVLNDIGPELSTQGLTRIINYVGVAPQVSSLDKMPKLIKASMEAQFSDLPDGIWETLAKRWYREGEQGVELAYDPALSLSLKQNNQDFDLWPLFDALCQHPTGLIWGLNSDLLTADIVERMKLRAPELEVSEIAGRGHVPFLNEPQAIAQIASVFERSFT